MGKGELLGLYQAGAKSRSAKQFMATIAHLRAALKEAEEQGKPSTFIQQARHDARSGILADLRETMAEERADLEAQLEKERGRYEKQFAKDSTAHHHALTRAKMLYESMGDKELAALAKDGTPPNDPDSFIALRSELRQRGLDDAYSMATIQGARLHITEPWKNTPVGEAVTQQLNLLADVSGGGVLVDGGGGKPVGISFDNVWSALEDAEETDDE